jgi:hypothetical protein
VSVSTELEAFSRFLEDQNEKGAISTSECAEIFHAASDILRAAGPAELVGPSGKHPAYDAITSHCLSTMKKKLGHLRPGLLKEFNSQQKNDLGIE